VRRALCKKPAGDPAGDCFTAISGQEAGGWEALACLSGQFRRTLNNRLRTGTDKGNLTV
jgi:hypothetical protein